MFLESVIVIIDAYLQVLNKDRQACHADSTGIDRLLGYLPAIEPGSGTPHLRVS